MSAGLPTPEKLRQAIVRAFHEESLKYEQIARLLGIGEATVSRVLRLHRETGGVAPRPRGGGNFSPIRGKVADELNPEEPELTTAPAAPPARPAQCRDGARRTVTAGA